MGQEATVVYLMMVGHTDEPFKVADVFARRESASEAVNKYNQEHNNFGFHAWLVPKTVKET